MLSEDAVLVGVSEILYIIRFAEKNDFNTGKLTTKWIIFILPFGFHFHKWPGV